MIVLFREMWQVGLSSLIMRYPCARRGYGQCGVSVDDYSPALEHGFGPTERGVFISSCFICAKRVWTSSLICFLVRLQRMFNLGCTYGFYCSLLCPPFRCPPALLCPGTYRSMILHRFLYFVFIFLRLIFLFCASALLCPWLSCALGRCRLSDNANSSVIISCCCSTYDKILCCHSVTMTMNAT